MQTINQLASHWFNKPFRKSVCAFWFIIPHSHFTKVKCAAEPQASGLTLAEWWFNVLKSERVWRSGGGKRRRSLEPFEVIIPQGHIFSLSSPFVSLGFAKCSYYTINPKDFGIIAHVRFRITWGKFARAINFSPEAYNKRFAFIIPWFSRNFYPWKV